MLRQNIASGYSSAATMVEVTRLIDPAMMVEMEVDAVLPDSATGPAR